MGIAKKLVEARKQVKANKTKINTLSYRFFTADDIIKAAKAAFDAQALALFPQRVEIIETSQNQGKNASMNQVTIKAEYLLVDGDTDDSINLCCLGRAQDAMEKNISKAQTQALKHLLMTILLITDNEEEQELQQADEILHGVQSIENRILNAKTDEDKKNIIKMINEVGDNSEKTRLNKLLRQKEGN